MDPTKDVEDAQDTSITPASPENHNSQGPIILTQEYHQTNPQGLEASTHPSVDPERYHQPTNEEIYGNPSMPPQPSPFGVAPMAHSPTAYGFPIHHYPQQHYQPFPHLITNRAASAIVYPMHGPHGYSHLAYPPPQVYGPLPQLQYATNYGEAGGSPMATYQPELAMPGVVPGNTPYIPNSTFYSTCRASGRIAPHKSYPAQGIQGQGMPVSGNGFIKPDINTVQYYSSRVSYEPYSRRSSSGNGNGKALKAITKNPLRKSKSSRHALWVGNLPSRVTILTLRDYFSQDFKAEIRSIFLISKSNCAFVNYQTETDCTRAIQKFHNSRFQGAQLVCRLRKSSSSGSNSSAKSPSVDGDTVLLGLSLSESQSTSEENEEAVEDEYEADVLNSSKPEDSSLSLAAPQAPERYFIMKSLTMTDLVQSVRTGLWATQRHNEDPLNNAYKSADAVYLIFSVNRSREYFGYARMASIIPDGESSPTELTARNSRADVKETRVTSTPATEHAPNGRIIEDLFRGTIIWEAERDEDDKTAESEEDEAWGKPFKVEWISTKRIPFYRSRGLRNRWNANKEVKVARDGTEIEPEAGKSLIQLFHELVVR